MKDLTGTKTLENLMTALAGESMARNKYDWFASQAKKDGYVQIQKVFEETALNEKEHAKTWLKYVNDGIGDTLTNLLNSAAGENDERGSMYKEMAETAREEGFDEIAEAMDGVAAIEREHEKRYLKLAQNIQDGKVFLKDDVVVWQCQNCGHIYVGKEAPEECPVCNHPQSYFQVKPENY